MATHSKIHPYINWTKERLDEMDASLGALEDRVKHQKAEAKAKGERVIGELKARRNEFQAALKKQADAGGAALEHAKGQLETSWHRFETELNAYISQVDAEIAVQEALFAVRAAAQEQAWREAVQKLEAQAAAVAAARRSEFDAAVKQMHTDAATAKARLEKLKTARRESWTAFSGALAESRDAFDRANQRGWDAFKQAMG